MVGEEWWMVIGSSEGIGRAAEVCGGVALYVREALDCMVLILGDDTTASFRVRMKGKENKRDVVGIYY